MIVMMMVMMVVMMVVMMKVMIVLMMITWTLCSNFISGFVECVACVVIIPALSKFGRCCFFIFVFSMINLFHSPVT